MLSDTVQTVILTDSYTMYHDVITSYRSVTQPNTTDVDMLLDGESCVCDSAVKCFPYFAPSMQIFYYKHLIERREIQFQGSILNQNPEVSECRR